MNALHIVRIRSVLMEMHGYVGAARNDKVPYAPVSVDDLTYWIEDLESLEEDLNA